VPLPAEDEAQSGVQELVCIPTRLQL
jgi:hypothetical protein